MNILSKKEVLEKFAWVGDLSEGLRRVRDFKGNEFHIKPDGTPAYRQRFEMVWGFSGGLAPVEDFEDNGFKINTKGERVN